MNKVLVPRISKPIHLAGVLDDMLYTHPLVLSRVRLKLLKKVMEENLMAIWIPSHKLLPKVFVKSLLSAMEDLYRN